MVKQVSGEVARYISAQRDRFFSRAAPMEVGAKTALHGFFRAEVLESTRFLVLNGERIENPEFYVTLRGLGFRNLPDFRWMAAVTLQDVVVAHEAFSDGLRFHELVHVEQYRQLGGRQFAELYVRGFLNGGGYEGIPLEINAYELGGRFETNPARSFSVEEEVAEWVKARRF
jgi:hypothetical protein